MRERSGRGERRETTGDSYFQHKALDRRQQLAERTVWINSRGIGIGVDKTIYRGIDRDIGADMCTSWGHRHTHRHM